MFVLPLETTLSYSLFKPYDSKPTVPSQCKTSASLSLESKQLKKQSTVTEMGTFHVRQHETRKVIVAPSLMFDRIAIKFLAVTGVSSNFPQIDNYVKLMNLITRRTRHLHRQLQAILKVRYYRRG